MTKSLLVYNHPAVTLPQGGQNGGLQVYGLLASRLRGLVGYQDSANCRAVIRGRLAGQTAWVSPATRPKAIPNLLAPVLRGKGRGL
jgi:hypothetical protein